MTGKGGRREEEREVVSTRTVISRIPHSVTGNSKLICSTCIWLGYSTQDLEILENLKNFDMPPSLVFELYFLKSWDNCGL